MTNDLRLLPWAGGEGKRCYLITDHHGGPIPRLADVTETIQLGMAANFSLTPTPCCRTPRPENSASSPS